MQNKNTEGCNWISVSDAARILNCSADLVRKLEREGKLPAIKLRSGMRLFISEEVRRLAQVRANACKE